MSHQPVTSRDPLAARLARLAPSPGGLDRDALLFHAGRAAARPGRFWPLAAAALAGLNLLTLAYLWPDRPVQRVCEGTARPAAAAAEEPAPAGDSLAPTKQAREAPGERRYLPWRQRMMERGGEDLPDSAAMAERSESMSDHPLSAFGAPYGLRPGARGRGMDYEMMAPPPGGR